MFTVLLDVNVMAYWCNTRYSLPGFFRNVTAYWCNTIYILSTWFLSDIRKSSFDPGSPSSIKVFTSRRSALLPEKAYTGVECSYAKVTHCNYTVVTDTLIGQHHPAPPSLDLQQPCQRILWVKHMMQKKPMIQDYL